MKRSLPAPEEARQAYASTHQKRAIDDSACVESGCHIPTRKMDAKGIALNSALALGWNPPTMIPRTAEVGFVGMEKLGGSNRRHSRRFGKSRPPTATPQIEKSWLNSNCGCVGNKTIKLFHSPSERRLAASGKDSCATDRVRSRKERYAGTCSTGGTPKRCCEPDILLVSVACVISRHFTASDGDQLCRKITRPEKRFQNARSNKTRNNDNDNVMICRKCNSTAVSGLISAHALVPAVDDFLLVARHRFSSKHRQRLHPHHQTSPRNEGGEGAQRLIADMIVCQHSLPRLFRMELGEQKRRIHRG